MIVALLALAAAAAPVSGVVKLRGSGDPLPQVDVRLLGADSGVLTDPEGRWTLDLPDGAVQLQFTSDTHHPVTLDLLLPTADTPTIFMAEATVYEIVVESFKPSAHTTRHLVDAEMALETPGTLEDSVRLVQSLPGVSVRREYSPGQADLSVRGSSPGENRYMLDGVDVPYLYHFNQYASVFPTTQIDTLELFPSTFGTEYGDAVGAIVDARSRQDRPGALHGSVGLSTVMASASVSAPVGKKGWWVAGSGRRSYQDLFGEQTAQFTLWPRFGDFALRAGRDGDNGRGVQVFAWGANDAYDRAVGELDLLDPVEASATPSFGYRRSFQVAGVETFREGATGESRWVNAVVHDRLRSRVTGGGTQDVDTLRWNSRARAEDKVSDHWLLAGGANLRLDGTSLRVQGADEPLVPIAREAAALARGIDTDQTLMRARGAVFGEAHWLLGDLRIMPGLRLPLDTASLSDERAVLLPEPRLSMRWQAAEQTQIKAATGFYQQLPDNERLLTFPELPTTRALQASVGIEQTVAGRLEFSAESYIEALDDQVLLQPGGEPAIGQGRAWGFELVGRYRLRETFFLWTWFAIARSQLRPDQEWVSMDGDQPVSAGLVASWDISKGWNVGARWRFGSGLPYTPIDGSIYVAGEDSWLAVPGKTNSARLPAYQKFDLHVEKKWSFQRWSLSMYVEAWYVPKPSAQLYPTWNYDYREQGWVVGPTFLPLAGARAEF